MSTRPTNSTDRLINVYKQAVRKAFTFLKDTYQLDDLYAKSIPLADQAGYLLPVCKLHLDDPHLISTLAQWRRDNAFAYPSQFTVTESGTASWLKEKVIGVEDRMLFLVVDRHGYLVGHLGFANAINDQMEIELDNIVRGVAGVAPGIMTKSMLKLIEWARENLGPKSFYLRVFSDNEHAIRFYRRIGFVDAQLIPLRRWEEGGSVFYRPLADRDCNPPDKYFLRMVYSPPRSQIETSDRVILTAGPSISAREASYALDAARYGWNDQWNKYIRRFEQAFADYLGVRYALSTSSCTGALHLALLGLGIGPGDEVIVPDITWVATANAVMYVGAIPVFADVEPDSWCIDPQSVQQLITEKTRAIIPVHLYGHPSRMDKILEIAKQHGLFVIEDAAPAIGAEFLGQKTGTFGDIAAFSFQGAKLVVTGEGGMLVTNNEQLYQRIYSLWDQGRTPGTFWINELGWKYKMSNIQAAIGLGQLERVDEMIEAKRRIFSWYAEGLEGVPYITLNQEMPWARSIYWMTSILVDERSGITRDEMRAKLKQFNIDTRPVFPAISQYPIWPRPQRPQAVAKRIGDQGINLPSGVRLTQAEVDYICSCIRKIMSGRMR